MSITSSVVSRFSHLLCLVAVIACGGGGDGPTNPPPTPSISLSSSAGAVTITQGQSGSVVATLGRSNFTGDVNLTVEGLPAGVTGTFAPGVLAGGTTQSTLTLSVAMTAATGTTSVTIRASGSGVTAATAAVSVTIAAAPQPAFTMTLAPTSGSAAQGASVSATVSVVRSGGFSGAVTLAATGMPTGVTATFGTTSLTGDATSLSLAVGATAAVGTSTITVTGTGGALTPRTATFILTVTAAPGSYTLSLAPPALSIQQGQNGQTVVRLARTNFTGAVSLALEGAPQGVSGTFGNSSLAGDSTVLTLTVGGAVAAGAYTLTVRGASQGQTDRTATLGLTVAAAPAGSISLALASAIPAIQQGNSAGVTVNITRANYTGNVTLAVTGLPTGVTASITPNPTPGNQVIVSFVVGATALPGSYGLTVTGTGTGIPAATVTGTLVVTATPAIAIAVTPTLDSVQVGGNRVYTVTITRTNFTDPVTLALSGATSTLTTVVNGSPATGTTATISVAVPNGTALGTYAFTVTASGTGVANATATFSMKVIQAPITSGNVTWSFGFCGSTERPVWLAAQNATGPWQQVTPSGDNYSFTIAASGGVAYVTQNGADDFDLTIFYGTTTELQARGTGGVCPTAPTKTVLGSVAGLSPGSVAQIALGGGATLVSAPATAFSVTNVRSGTVDLFAARSVLDFANPLSGLQVDKLLFRRNLNPANGATLPVLDFGGSEAFNPERKNVTVNGANGQPVSIATSYTTANGGSGGLSVDLPATETARTYVAVPVAQQATGDLHIMTASALVLSGQTVTSTRAVSGVFKTATDLTITLGGTLGTPTTSLVGGAPYARPRMVLAQHPDYGRYWAVGYAQAVTGPRSAFIQITQGYLGNATLDQTIPDFTGVAGWQNSWGLKTGVAMTYLISASGWTLGGNGTEAPFIEGTEVRTATRSGTVNP